MKNRRSYTPFIFVLAIFASRSSMAEQQPDATMLAPIEKIARFLETRDDANLSGFADQDVVIIENFAPFLFSGPDAVTRWANGMRGHLNGLTELAHEFGPVQNFSVDGDLVFLSLPTHWSGAANGQRFVEDGGWAFVLVKQAGEWRVRNYGWAVTRLSAE